MPVKTLVTGGVFETAWKTVVASRHRRLANRWRAFTLGHGRDGRRARGMVRRLGRAPMPIFYLIQRWMRMERENLLLLSWERLVGMGALERGLVFAAPISGLKLCLLDLTGRHVQG